MLLLVALVLLTAPVAARANGSWFLTNDQGLLTNRFGSSETVLVNGSAVGGVGIIPAVDLYVADHRDWSDQDGQPLVDVSNPLHVPNTVVGFEVIEFPIWLPYLRVGSYDVVVDKNQNGIYDAGTDDVLGDQGTPAFTVFFDGNRRAIDKQALKQQYAVPWKQVSDFAKLMQTTVQSFQVADQVSGALQFATAPVLLWNPPPPYVDDIPCATSQCGPVTHALEWGASNVGPLSTLWNASGDPTGTLKPMATYCAQLVDSLFPNQTKSCKVPVDPTAAVSSADFGSAQLGVVSANLDRVLAGIAADPPDPGFTNVWSYSSPATVFGAATAEAPGPDQAALANLLNKAAVRSTGLLHALERFDGAAGQGDDYWAGRQATSLSQQAYALVDLLKNIKSRAVTAAAAMRGAGQAGFSPQLRTALATLQDRLANGGFSDAERLAMTAAGWSSAEIGQLEADLRAVPAAELPDDVPAMLDMFADRADAAIGALWNLAVYAEDVGTSAPRSEPPHAQFTASAQGAAHPRAFSFNASGTTDDGSIASYAWNFGDGGAASGVAPEHAYQTTGWRWVSLTVTDDTGLQDSAGQWVWVDNALPVAAFDAAPLSGESPLKVDVDASASADPDGSIGTVAWQFGDGSSASGVQNSHTYEYPGVYSLQLTVTDNDGGVSSAFKTVTVSGQHAPLAAFTMTPQSGSTPLDVTLDATGSTDPDGALLNYAWDFGDDSPPGSGAVVHHTFEKGGSFKVTLTVTGSSGAKASAAQTIGVTWSNRAPIPQGDALVAERTGVIDVLANDSDPDGDPFTLDANIQPEHGSATCSKTGACLYRADGGYVGPDTFSYTVRDPGGREATAVVSVTSTRPAADLAGVTARDDAGSTGAGHILHLSVLSNDAGSGDLAIVTTTNPQHGTVTCSAAGACDYSPEEGFVGDDAFSYTVHDTQGHQANADVHVTVAPLSTGYRLSLDGRASGADPGVVGAGAHADWAAGVTPDPADATDADLAAFRRPRIDAVLHGDHTIDAATVHVAKGWAVSDQTDTTIRAQAGDHALLGSVTESFVRPLPPISQGTGGDGHVPILVGTKVFAFYHHSTPTSVTCVDRRTGMRCPGYPHMLNVASSNVIGPGAVIGTRIYVHTVTATGYAQHAAVGLYCWDSATDAPCPMVLVERTPGAGDPGGSAPVAIGGRAYFVSGSGRLFCIDPATNAPCADHPSIDTGFSPFGGGEFDIVTHGSRIYASRLAGTTVSCIDVASWQRCPGWDQPQLFSSWDLVNWHAADGSAIGVCAVAAGGGQCVSDDAPQDRTSLSGWPSGETYYSATAEAETGTRTLVGSLSSGGVGCWDWAAMATCAGGGYGGGGWLTADIDGNGLPSAYGVAWDGSCAVGLGDPGMVFTVDPAGSSPCNSLTSGASRVRIDLRDQRCDATVGRATWASVSLANAQQGELASVAVTVRDATTGELLRGGDVSGQALDLSGIDPSVHPAITIDATARSAPGNPAWGDAIPPKLRIAWHADAKQLCFATTPPTPHCAAPAAELTVSAGLAEGAADERRVTRQAGAACPASPTSPPEPRVVPSRATASEIILGCAKRRVVLEDVFEEGGRVHFLGVADRTLAGKSVEVVLAASGNVVARAAIGGDGGFSATAPLPPRAIRSTNRARYQARLGKLRSLNLKLARRLVVTSLTTSGAQVVIAGRVTRPLADVARRGITVERVANCRKRTTVMTFKPRADGRFAATFTETTNPGAAVYRLATEVRVSARSRRLAQTFSLPRAVDFR